MTIVVGPNGTVNSLALDQLLNRIVDELNQQRLDITSLSDSSSLAPAESFNAGVPKPDGLRLLSGPVGGITVEVNSPGFDNFLRWDWYIDTDAGFPNPIIIPDTSLQFSWNDGEPDRTYYFKVRALNKDKVAGPFSSILDTSTGLAITEDLALGTSTNVTEQYIVSPDFSPAVLNTDSASATYGNLVVNCKGRPVMLFIVLTFGLSYLYVGAGSNRITTIILRDGVQINDAIITDMTSGSAAASPYIGVITTVLTVSLLNPIDEPPAGTHTYSVQVTLSKSVGNTLSVTPLILSFGSLELRR